MRVGFIGAGKMAQALAKGLIQGELTLPEKIFCSCPRTDVSLLDKMRRLGCRTSTDNCQVADDSRVLILAVKPPVIPLVLKEISSFVTPQHLVISVAMGITTRHIEQVLPPKSRVIRVMPNTPALVREGASVFSCGSATLEDDAATAHRIFSSVGICDEIEENLLDAVTGLSGSGPAYMYMAIEALADGGVKMGIRRDLALKLAAQTLLGAARMVLETNQHPGSLKDDVCSPGGTSIQAVHQLENSGFRPADKILYNYAIEMCQCAALEELFGDPKESFHRYQTAQILLHSLGQQVNDLRDKELLYKYRDAVQRRLEILTNNRSVYAYHTT